MPPAKSRERTRSAPVPCAPSAATATIAGADTPRATQRSRSASRVVGSICDAVMSFSLPGPGAETIRVPDKANRGLWTSHHSRRQGASAVCPAMEIWELGAVELAAALRARELSAVDALRAVGERADAIGELNPFALRLDDRALAAANAADAQLALDEGGPLCGVPLTVKDSHYMA